MPHPTLTTSWPVGNDLRAWLGSSAVSAITDTELIDELTADASAAIYESIDPAKLPVDPDQCPMSIFRAIILEAARMLYRRQSPHGAAAFGDVAIRLRNVDVDVQRLVSRYRIDPQP